MQTQIMGILNVTPDSFSDGGYYTNVTTAVQHAKQMVAEGAHIIDVGGESTRPGAQAVSVEDELARVIPVITALRHELDIPISIDTSKPEVMRAAVQAGVTMINDVYALRLPGALQAAFQCNVPICLMHMQGDPGTMQQAPKYVDIITEVKNFFAERITACENVGIDREKLILDFGFGFGKTVQHNLQLIKNLAEFKKFNLPLLVGVSRKSTIGTLLDKPANERLYGSIAATILAVEHGANIIRTHDVAATVDAVKVTEAVMQC
jgi:dihydropteroate synthase